ncbi:glycosyltransferase [Parabacteroides sp.]
MRKRTAIVVVLYHVRLSERLIGLSREDSSLLIVIDNTPDRDLGIGDERLVYIPLKVNKGIAFAQNRGIEEAFRYRCGYVVFFDQDSELPKEYVSNIVKEYERVDSLVPHLFLLGPTLMNGRTQEEYKSTIHRDKQVAEDFFQRREIISSGSCVSMEKIKVVGLNDESLFIDCVDHEWCWRAVSEGFINGVTSRVSLTHYVGQQEYRLFNQLVIISSPIRYYYQTRNYLWLLRRSYVPLQWKINHGIKIMIYPLSFPFKVKSWRAIYTEIWRGLRDGLK